MKYYSIASLLILAIIAFSACGKGDFFDKDLKKTDQDKICFELVYPITYIMPDDSAISGDNETSVNAAIKAWYAAHPDSKAKYALLYPVEIVFEDGTIKTIKDETEMIAAKKHCNDDAIAICNWDYSKVSDDAVWKKYIVKDLVTDDACGCIVSGTVKYVKNGSSFAYVVDYGDGSCDAWAFLATYYGGDAKKVKKCKFKLDCLADGE